MDTLTFVINFVSSNPGYDPEPSNPITSVASTGDFTAIIVGIAFALLAVCSIGVYVFRKTALPANANHISNN